MNSLEATLEAVKAAVRKADFVSLGQLAPELDAALAKAETERPSQTELAQIARVAEQNAILLEAARRGLRAARRRVEEVRRAASGLQTYDMRGHRAEISTGSKLAGRF